MTAADAAAHANGLRVGMPATTARVLVPGLIVEEHDEVADAAALDRIALWMMQRYAPIVAADPPDGIVLDTSGADHLHGGENVMLTSMVQRLAASGASAKAAVADTWGAAHAIARFSGRSTSNILRGDARAAMDALPIVSLRLPIDLVSGLHVLGFSRVADLLEVPRAPLTLRFGPELGRRLDQALGLLAEPIDPIRPDEIVRVRRAFAEPIGAPETISRYLGKLVIALCEGLTEHGLGAKRLDLLCHRVDNTLQAIRVGTALPVRDPKRLTRLLTDKVETIEPGFGIECLELAATLAEPLGERQAVTSLIDEATPDISDLVDVLANTVGEQRLFRQAPVASDVPERSVMRIAPMAPDTGASWPDCWPRPSRLLARPELIETMALLPDHPPAWFSWRGVRHRVRRGDGPERVFGEWWLGDREMHAVRDYFRVENDAGERFWLFRAGDGQAPETGSHRWYLHGLFG
ncbi:nucleotidyltransferase [Azorhizobium oxalatiphilum]|uniref:Nucleotidyltransferase n=1 Tax=Azorhizobium oxalatiphilum TaxID=980631 RepID=A0A917FDK7_9HYPH|nr:nucleotidyltransferase [Azorhizobium oxalatiphilum]